MFRIPRHAAARTISQLADGGDKSAATAIGAVSVVAASLSFILPADSSNSDYDKRGKVHVAAPTCTLNLQEQLIHRSFFNYAAFIAPKVALCESPTKPPSPTIFVAPAPSRGRRLLHSLHLADLPTPRLLTQQDPIFDYPSLRAGLRQRAKDEKSLRSLGQEAMDARQSGDVDRINDIFAKISSIAYGKGVTPQEREDFLVRHGCTAWTDEALSYLVEELAVDRGILEIGAGNGQWARAIRDRHDQVTAQNGRPAGANGGKAFEFIIPYDDMTDLPLNQNVYHRHTQPFHQYFHPNVRKCDSHLEAIRKWESRGRVLLLVFPSPGPFALECVKEYVSVHPDGNDTVVYVGEGRGGANANEDLFSYFCNGEWTLEKVVDVKSSPGGKGYEKLFVLRRVIKSTQQ